MRFNKSSLSIIFFILSLCSVPAGSEPITQGAMLSITCNGCHGTDGNSKGSIPSIKGIPAETISKAMRDFRDDKRTATVMNRHAKGYSDGEIKLIAEYFASKK